MTAVNLYRNHGNDKVTLQYKIIVHLSLHTKLNQIQLYFLNKSVNKQT